MKVKFMTCAKNSGGCLIFALLMICSAQVRAEEQGSSNSAVTYTMCEQAQEKADKPGATETAKKSAERCWAAFEKLTGSSTSGGSCDFADYKTKKEKFRSLCTQARATTSSSGSGGEVACSESLDKCSEQGANSEELSTPRDSEYSESTDTSDPLAIDVDKKRSEYDICPSLSGVELENFKKEVEESQKTVDDLEDRIPEMEDAIHSANSSLNDKLSSLQDQKVSLQKEYADQKKSLERNKKDRLKQLEDQISEIQNQIFKLESDIRAANLTKAKANLDRDEAVKQIYLQCHGIATKEVSDRRIALFNRAQAGLLNRGSFGTALKNVGLSDRQADQRLAEQLYDQCKKSKPTKDAIDSANKRLAQTLSEIDTSISVMQKQITMQNEAMTKIKDQSGCGPQSQSEMCRALQEFQQDRYDLDVQTAQQSQKIDGDEMRARSENAAMIATKSQALVRAQERLKREQNYLDQKRALLAMRSEISGGRSVSQDVRDNLMMAYTDLTGKMDSLQDCCRSAQLSSDCQEIKAFLSKRNRWNDDSTTAPASSPTTQPRPERPQNPPPRGCQGPNCAQGTATEAAGAGQ